MTSTEENAREQLNILQDLFQKRRDAANRGDKAEMAAVDQHIVSAMHNVGNAYPDEESKDAWHSKANQYESSNAEEKENILMPLAKGLGILIATPFAVAGGAIFAAGGILYGAGKTIQGVGNLLTGGVFNH
ncbi:hypothetical protein BN14_09049 [Rhizoctonia solani AG-1 IB]|uniref:Uncharacterized protein n=1 Tax=Thanatephorus cucumeris (strain AG1-IB / isolate 7/3/14) TaxID=1108050 RepID=M5C4Q2_THACB|nr:hypothetical protein BN14_09049 [Rhizoctonia solani AG-1 IB]